MLFKFRGVNPVKEDRPKTLMTIADLLAFRDTWTEIPSPGFSVERVLLRSRLEKQRKAEIPKLVMSENGFRVRDKATMDEVELELRHVQSTLNKLTEQNFDAVLQEMMKPELVFNPAVLKGAVNIIFMKAVSEPVFSAVYARLCLEISNYERKLNAEMQANPDCEANRVFKLYENDRQKNMGTDVGKGPQAPNSEPGGFVRVALILRCQNFHEAFMMQSTPEDPEAAEKVRKQNMANIKFVGELFMTSLVTNKVIMIVTNAALTLGLDPNLAKTTVTDVDLEMVINLMNVVGKRCDECMQASFLELLWGTLEKCSTDKRFSNRIRFLLQNLLEWRASGWKPKEVALPQSSSDNSGGNATGGAGGAPPTHSSTMQSGHSNANNAGGGGGGGGGRGSSGPSPMPPPPPPTAAPPQHSGGGGMGGGPSGNYGNVQRNMHRSVSLNQQDNYTAPHPNRRQDRVTSYSDLGQFGSYPMPPPPPFQPTGPPPPFPGAPEISEEDRKLMALAQPPRAFTGQQEVQLLSILRDAVLDGDWKVANDLIRESVPGEAEHVCRMCAVNAAMKKMSESKQDEDREVFMKALKSSIFDVNALSRGFSWCLTSAIVNNVKEDYPRAFSRIVNVIVGTEAMSFVCVVRDVMARTANYLDALFVPLEGDETQWEEDFVDVWSTLVTEWKKQRSGKAESPAEILDSIASVKQRPFMKDIAPDFVMELVRQDIVPDEAIATWAAANRDNDRFKPFLEQLEQLFPAL